MDSSSRPARLLVKGLQARAEARIVLGDVSFSVGPGEIVCVVGPNGSGKTTLLECIAGLRAVSAGSIELDGHSLRTFADRTSRVAYVPDADVLPEEASLGVALALRPGGALVDRFHLGPLLGSRASEVSRGESKRAQLCAALDLRRPLLLLDEPFAAFDPRQLRFLLPLFREVLLETTSAALVSVHQMRVAELVADRLLLLDAGRVLAFGSLAALGERAGFPGASLDDVVLALLDREGHADALP